MPNQGVSVVFSFDLCDIRGSIGFLTGVFFSRLLRETVIN
jgi:hypothetical protein